MELCTLSLKIIYFWSVPNHLVTVNSVTSNMVELPELIEFKSKLLNQMMRYMVLEDVVSDHKLLYELKCAHDIRCQCETSNGPLPLFVSCVDDFMYLHAVVLRQPFKKSSGMSYYNETTRDRMHRSLGFTIVPLKCPECGKRKTCQARQNM